MCNERCQAEVFLESYFGSVSCAGARTKLVVDDFSPSMHALRVELDTESFVHGLSLRDEPELGLAGCTACRWKPCGRGAGVVLEDSEDDTIEIMVDTKPLLM